MLQGNVDQAVKWSPDFAERTLADYESLTRRAAAQGARLVLWPETAVPGSPDYSDELADRLATLAREAGVTLVAGAVGVEPVARGALRYYDSAFVIAADGTSVDRYDKTHLVPFGEYVSAARRARALRVGGRARCRDDGRVARPHAARDRDPRAGWRHAHGRRADLL